MASSSDNTTSTTPATESSTPSPQRLGNQRAGRGRGRGRGNSSYNQDPTHGDARRYDGAGGRRARGGPRGANNGGGRPSAGPVGAADLSTRFTQPLSMGVQQGETPKATPQAQGVAGVEGGKEEDAEVCFICASPVVHYSVAPCNHRTCHICALRMRALYKTKDCAHCRREAQYVVFTDSPSKQYEEFTPVDIISTDENIGIKYEKADIVEDTILLLRYNCPDPSCDVACLGWPDLHRHVRSVHHKKMCDLCTRNKKVFTHEHELFTDKELERHMKKGDDSPGAIDQSGFKGHPLCGFCGERFYGDDELYVHCRAKHERCFICDRSNPRHPQYYVNYDSLEQHFKKDHFLCPERECLEKKFIVFPSEIDLKAHQLQEHGNTLSKDVRRDARIVDISSFDYRAPYVQERRGGGSQREGRGRGRGRDPNTDPIPASTAQPLRRDEQAFQRQMAIQSAQSVSTRTFGGQLTTQAPAGRGTPGPTSMSVPRPSSNIEQVASQLSGAQIQDTASDLHPQEQARRLRHATVIERVSTLLQNDPLKLTQFRNSISSYRTGTITAAALIDTFFALFSDTSSSALGSLVRDVADLYEDKSKAEALRTAWNDWRAINEDYPSLPGPSGLSGSSLPLGWAQVITSTPSSSANAQQPKKNTSRVLKLKSSTAQSSRSSASRNASWGSASASSANGFPGLPRPAPASSNPISTSISSSTSGPRMSSNATPWLNATSSYPSMPSFNSNSNPNSVRPTPPTSRPASRGPIRTGASDASAFPALPPASKPTSTIFGYGSGMVRRGAGGSSGGNFSWGGSGNAAAGPGDGQQTQSEGETNGQGKKKGNKGKKQVLVQWG